MGKRNWQFECRGCGEQFWNWFEQMDREEAVNLLQNLECDECGEDYVEFTGKTRFAGGPLYLAGAATFLCRDCRTEFAATVTGVETGELASTLSDQGCPECDSANWKVRDGIKMAEKIEA